MVIRILKYLYIAAVYLVLYVPLFVTIVFSFNNSSSADVWNGFTLKWYESLLTDKSLINAALRSLFLAATAATTATVVGTIIAIALHRYRFIGQKVVYGSLSVIMLSPEIIQGISLVMIFVILGIPLGFTTLLLSHTVFCFPFVTITVLARLRGVNRNLAESAADGRTRNLHAGLPADPGLSGTREAAGESVRSALPGHSCVVESGVLPDPA